MNYMEVDCSNETLYFKGETLEAIDNDSNRLVIRNGGSTIAVFTDFNYWRYVTEEYYKDQQ